MSKQEKLSHGEYWKGTYRHVRFKIVRWEFYDGKPAWNYYLYVPLKQVPEDQRDRFDLKVECDEQYSHRCYPYMSTGIMSNIYWHGGITFFDKLGGHDGFSVVIKAGCDFSHYWDEGCIYDLDIVRREAQRTIDDLWGHVPGLHFRCSYTGKYVPESDGKYNEHGTFTSNEGIKKEAEYKAEQEKEKADVLAKASARLLIGGGTS